MQDKELVRQPVDSIVAIATPPGRGGVGIVRISGPLVPQLMHPLLHKKKLIPREGHFCSFYDSKGALLDQGLALYFPAPNSFTGEDVLELQMHGSPVVLDELVSTVISLGARIAEPGEFSRRAYLNEKMDLAQAEAIADLIHSTSLQAANRALRSLTGVFSERVHQIAAMVLKLRVYVEAAIDFPEEELDYLGDGLISQKLTEIQTQLKQTLKKASQGVLLTEGLQVVLAGEPNAGKSSLLNFFSGYEAAIVTAIPGTTRDIIKEQVSLRGVPVTLLDTAGLRETDELIEKMGIERAKKAISSADVVLWMVDEGTSSLVEARQCLMDFLKQEGLQGKRYIIVLNKADQTLKETGKLKGSEVVRISLKTGAGVEALTDLIVMEEGLSEGEGIFSARKRHVVALTQALTSVEQAQHQLEFKAGELIAEDLKQAHQALGDIVGTVSSDNLLGEIFSTFCIGK